MEKTDTCTTFVCVVHGLATKQWIHCELCWQIGAPTRSVTVATLHTCVTCCCARYHFPKTQHQVGILTSGGHAIKMQSLRDPAKNDPNSSIRKFLYFVLADPNMCNSGARSE